MKLRLLIACGILLVALGGCSGSKKLFSLSGLEANAPTSGPVYVKAYEDKYGQYDGVYLRYEKVIENSGSKDPGAMSLLFSTPPSWKYQEINRTKYIVFNPDNSNLTSFFVWTKPDDLYLRITNPDGTKREYGLDDLREEPDSYGDVDYRFVFPDVQRGSVIETGYAIEFKVGGRRPPLSHSVLLQRYIPADSIIFTYACPDWWQIEVKRIGMARWPQVDTLYDAATHKKLFRAVRGNVPAIKLESYGPYFMQIADYLEFHVTSLVMGGAEYKMTTSWQKMGENMSKGLIGKLDEVSESVRSATAAAVDTAGTQLGKVNCILAFVRDSIALDGKNRSGNPDKVLSDRKGNEYDQTALASAMLKEAGIINDYLLVHSALDGYCDLNYVSPGQFYSPALGCKIDGDYYTLFPYVDGLPAGVIPPWFLGQDAMALNEGISMKTVSDHNQVPSGIDETYDVSIGDDGVVSVHEARRLTGGDAFLARDSLLRLDQEGLDRAVKGMVAYVGGDIDLTTSEVRNLKDPTLPLELNFAYTIDNLVTVTPEEVLFQTAGLFSPVTGTKVIDDPAERVNDVVVEYAEDYHKTVRIRYPESWALTTPLSNTEASNDFGTIAGQYEVGAGEIDVVQQSHLNRIQRPREAYADFLTILGKHGDLYIPTLVFGVNGAGSAPAEPASPEEGQG